MAVFGKGVKRRPSWLNCYHSVCVCVCSFRIVQFLSRIHCRILSKSSKHEQLLQFKYRFLFYAVQIQRENKKWIHFSGFNSMVSVFPYFEIGNTDFFFSFCSECIHNFHDGRLDTCNISMNRYCFHTKTIFYINKNLCKIIPGGKSTHLFSFREIFTLIFKYFARNSILQIKLCGFNWIKSFCWHFIQNSIDKIELNHLIHRIIRLTL